MGSRSDYPESDEEIAKLSLEELNAEIARCNQRMKIARTTYLRKESFKRIERLEIKRESLFGVPRVKRTFRARST